MPTPFNKPWLEYSQQVALLQGRGLTVSNPALAIQFLSHVNYYRLSGYCVTFENGSRHTFVPGTTFEQLRYLYEFDFDLRDLLCEALEIIEVDVRTTVAHYFGKAYGPFGHTSSANFYHSPPRLPHRLTHPARPVFEHADWIAGLHKEVKRSKELFVEHHRNTYSDYPDLPLWIATEVMSFGTLSRMCEGMLVQDQRNIAAHYGVQRAVLLSWSHHLTVVRNHCAHHSKDLGQDLVREARVASG